MNGWICPRCSRVWAPSISTCMPCGSTPMTPFPIYPQPYVYPTVAPLPTAPANPWWWPTTICTTAGAC